MTSRVRLAAIVIGCVTTWAVIGGAVVTVTAPTPTPSTITRVETVERVVVVTPPPTPIATPRIAVPVVCDRAIDQLLENWTVASGAIMALRRGQDDDPSVADALDALLGVDAVIATIQSCRQYPRIEP
jgi:hypothetical protein